MIDKNKLIKSWSKNRFTLHLFYDGYDYEHSKSRMSYIFKDGRKTIFTGNDFFSSPLHAIDSLNTVYSLLSFICLQKGDTDQEYFDNYTSEQIEWSKSNRCEELSLLVMDWENK